MVIIFSPEIYIEFHSEGLWLKTIVFLIKIIGYFLFILPPFYGFCDQSRVITF